MAPAETPDAVARYAEHADAILDLHLPASPDRAPVLFFIHGGFWKQTYDRTHTRPLARALADRGWVVATPEYRRVGGLGGWPATAYDVRDAFAHLPSALAAVDVRPTRTVVAGHSAGGHLTLWLASEEVAGDVDLFVPLAPVADLREADRLGLGSGAVAGLMGDHDLGEADPMTRLAEGPRIHVLHGVDDGPVPISLTRRLVDRHPWITSTELPIDHFEFLETSGPTYERLVAAIEG